MAGKKFDGGKPPVDLLPKKALIEIAKVLGFGAKKYDPWNWKGGFKWSRLEAATLRHLFAYAEGEDIDAESGLPHLAHAGCCILFLLTHYLESLGCDDRFKGAE